MSLCSEVYASMVQDVIYPEPNCQKTMDYVMNILYHKWIFIIPIPKISSSWSALGLLLDIFIAEKRRILPTNTL